MGAGGINLPQDVANLSDGLLSLGGLGLSGWLPRTTVPNSRLNAAIVGFQRLNHLKPDGLVNPDGPTIKVLNGYLPLPTGPETMARAPMVEAAVLNQSPETLPGRDITARGMGDAALERGRAEEARYEADLEAERRADDPFGDILGGNQRRYQRNHIDDMLDEQNAETRAQLDREALAGLDPNSLMTKLGYRPNEQAVFSPMGMPGRTFRDAIAADEWKIYDPTALREMRVKNYYQLTKIALQDIGMMDGEEWTGKWGINSEDEFKKNWAVQEDAMTLYMDHIEGYMRGASDELDLFDLRGQQIVGILDPSKPITVTPVGLMAVGHRWGAQGIRDYMEHLEKNGWVSNFDELPPEIAKKFKAIERRLRVFQNGSYN